MRESNMLQITHKRGMPIGWLNKDGKHLPVFVCSKTRQPITPDMPGTLYWNPDTGDMLVLSDSAEDSHCEFDSKDFPYSTTIDVHSLCLFFNTAGPDGSATQKQARDKADLLRSL